jgi:SAM-dependent methyltransferase
MPDIAYSALPDRQVAAERVRVQEVCPACGDAGATREWSAPGFQNLTDDGVFMQPDYRIRDCPRCGLLFKTRTLSEAEFERYYASADFSKWETDGFYPTEDLAKQVLASLPKGSAVLDFGCSSGRLLAPFTGQLDCYGVEANQTAAARARDKGICIVTMDQVAGRGRFLDCIVMMDVFEHLLAPVELLLALTAALRPGGKLVIATGDSDYPLCRADPASFWYLRTVEHVCMWNRKHALYLQTVLGLNLVQWSRCSHYRTAARQWLFQSACHVAYGAYRRGGRLVRSVISATPVLRKVAAWTSPPFVTFGRDHVVAIFEVPASPPQTVLTPQ